MGRLYGVSVASMVPWSLRMDGLGKSVRMAWEAGYNGVQALPLKGWNWHPGLVAKWSDNVISYEFAWAYGSLWSALLRTLGFAGHPNPTIIDYMMFGRKNTPLFPRSIFVSHDFGGNLPVEIHPELSVDVDDYLDYISRGGSVVWDTLHVRRQHRVDGSKLMDWAELLKRLPPYSISLIHVHPTRKETQEFLSGLGPLTSMLEILGYETDAPAIIEAAPTPKTMISRLGMIKYLSDLREATERWLK